MFEEATTINCRGRILDLSSPKVMGIINITDDSFYSGSKLKDINAILRKAEEMFTDGASIIDIGGMSSRPGSEPISEEEELNRVIPCLQQLNAKFPEGIFSIDTYRSRVAYESYQAGAAIINDISAGRMDDKMYQTVADLGAPYVLMHMQGTPTNMQLNPEYEDVALEVLDFFIAEIGKLRSLGIKDIIIDPGFGFGKTLDHNYQLLQRVHVFKLTSLPIMIGISRKSMIYKLLDISPEMALNGTSALNMYALQQGAKLLRVHDVKDAVEVIKLFSKLQTVKS
jgi:dihydropteroate synthase